MIPTLYDISFASALSALCQRKADTTWRKLHLVPEEAVLLLLEGVLAAGRLTPHSLAAFAASGHERVLARIEALHVREPPPVLPITRNPWLGDEWRRW